MMSRENIHIIRSTLSIKYIILKRSYHLYNGKLCILFDGPTFITRLLVAFEILASNFSEERDI